MEQIYSFLFSKPGNQNDSGQTTAFLKPPSKAEISKKAKIVSFASFTTQTSRKKIKGKHGHSSGLGTIYKWPVLLFFTIKESS